MALPRQIRTVFLATISTIFLVALYHFTSETPFSQVHLSHSTNSSYQVHSPQSRPHIFDHNTWWTSETEIKPKFAYVQYATSEAYFCNALINVKRLRRFGTVADVVIMYPSIWDAKPTDSPHARMLLHARSSFPELHLEHVDIISTSKGDATWAQSLTKFHAFQLSQYSRVLYFDSDSLVLNSMDHYFLAPLSRLAVPRAYWLDDADTASIAEQTICSHIMLLQPDPFYYASIMNETKRSGEFDMEVINTLFKGSAMILPHRRLALLSGEFRNRNHRKYLSEDPEAEWNAMAEASKSVLVHFSDWPLPKPWKPRTSEQWIKAMPACDENDERDMEKDDRPPCADRLMWTGFYEEYETERGSVCDAKW